MSFLPLYDTPLKEQLHTLRECIPDWADMEVTRKGKFLGFIVGPYREEDSWIEPMRKYLDRTIMWAGRGLGLHLGVMAYNTFAVSVLGFVAQLEPP